MSDRNSCENPGDIQNRVPVTNWELDKYLLNAKETVVVEMVRRGCIAFPEYLSIRYKWCGRQSNQDDS